jgi:hypothetical protein
MMPRQCSLSILYADKQRKPFRFRRSNSSDSNSIYCRPKNPNHRLTGGPPVSKFLAEGQGGAIGPAARTSAALPMGPGLGNAPAFR